MKYFIIGLLTSFVLFFTPAQEYPQTFIVSEIDKQNDIIYLETFTGHVYTWEGVEDWFINDIAAATMSDNGTPDDITDDKIIDLKYTGYIE